MNQHELRELCSSNIEHLSKLLITDVEADLELIIQKLMTLHDIYLESELAVKATQ